MYVKKIIKEQLRINEGGNLKLEKFKGSSECCDIAPLRFLLLFSPKVTRSHQKEKEKDGKECQPQASDLRSFLQRTSQ